MNIRDFFGLFVFFLSLSYEIWTNPDTELPLPSVIVAIGHARFEELSPGKYKILAIKEKPGTYDFICRLLCESGGDKIDVTIKKEDNVTNLVVGYDIVVIK